MTAKRFLPWLIPGLFLILAAALFMVPGYSFSALICLGIAAVIICYELLRILALRHLTAAKILKTILSAVLCFGILLTVCTEALILNAARGGDPGDTQYVIVLGAGVRGTTPSQILRSRIDAAYEYLSAHPDAVCIVSGGQGDGEDISEAQCMYDHLTDRGIDGSRIWMEDKSTSTEENFQFSLSLIQEKTGIIPSEIAVISSEFHLYRAGLYARGCGVTAIGIPAETPYLSLKINYYLREAAGVWLYFLFGG